MSSSVYTSSASHLLHTACIKSDIETVALLLETGIDFTEKYMDSTLLHIVCALGRLEILELMLKYKPNLSCVDVKLREPIHVAVYWGNSRILESLIQRGAKVDSVDFEGNTPLHYAVKYSKHTCKNILLNYGANEYSKNIYNQIPSDLE